MSQLLLIKKIPLTREDKRRMTRESETIITTVERIEIEFGKYLFEENDFSYQELYSHYLQKYKDSIAYLNICTPKKFVAINSYYFKEQYGPTV